MISYKKIVLWMLILGFAASFPVLGNVDVSLSDDLTFLSPKSIEVSIIGTNASINNHSKGGSIQLPHVKKTYKADNKQINVLDDLLDISDEVTNLSRQLEELREVEKYSHQLGLATINIKYLNLYKEAVNWLGTPYRYGAMSKKSVDCSGFTKSVFASVFNIDLPRVSRAMARNLVEIKDKKELEPGDLVFFATRGRRYINHVGIYLGDKRFIHASRSHGVEVASLDDSYYIHSWKRAGRVLL